MLRKMIIALTLALVGLFAATGVVSAAPVVVTSYQPGGAVTIAAANDTVALGSPMRLSGSGFASGETITFTLADGTVLGTTVADANGNYSFEAVFNAAGANVVTAVGGTSHRTATITVNVVGEGTTTSLGTTTVAVSTQSEGTTTAAGAGSGSTGTGTGLASTGVSLAGPLTLGVSALLAGLALLFFGTRLVIRRKHGPSTH